MIDREAIDRFQDEHFRNISSQVVEGMQELKIPGGVL
jgi:hypothetical protein